MGKLPIEKFRYITSDQFRALTAVEMGMKNHELVPEQLVAIIASLKNAEIRKIVMELCRVKLIVYERCGKNTGYRLTQAGYDFLALRTLTQQNIITSFGNQIGVGKESDVFAVREGGSERCLKLHRLGTSSFRAVNSKRDYIGGRRHASWLYLARLAAEREYAYLKALHSRNFPVPQPFALNRNAVVMQLLHSCVQLNHVKRAVHTAAPRSAEASEENQDIEHCGNDVGLTRKAAQTILKQALSVLTSLAASGLVHGDYNEFNLLIDPVELRLWVIDMPQATSRDHANADEFFERDVRCVERFFRRRFGIILRRRTRAEPEGEAEKDVQGSDTVHQEDNYEMVEGEAGAEAESDDETELSGNVRRHAAEGEPLIKLSEIKRTDWIDCELRASGYDKELRKKLIAEGRIVAHPGDRTKRDVEGYEEEEEEDDNEDPDQESESETKPEESEQVEQGMSDMKVHDENSASGSDKSGEEDDLDEEEDDEDDKASRGDTVRNRVGGEARRAKQRERARQIKRKWDATATAQRRREMRDNVKQSLSSVWY